MEDLGQSRQRAPQYEAREAAKPNLFTGKTYNSVDNIQQFFNERGKVAPPSAAAAAPPAAKPAPAPKIAQPVAAGRTRGFRAGAMIRHPKYGRGTVLRREGDGEDAKLTVSFPGYGLKKLVEKYAGIQED